MGFRLGRPGNIKVTPDGAAVLFTRTPPRSRVADLYSFDVATGQTTRLLSAADVVAGGGEAEQLSDEEKARRERARKATRGVTGYELSRDGAQVLVSLGGQLHLIERKSGVIINFSSGAGWDGMVRKSHYSAAKGALRILTKTIAREVGQFGIRCNCVVPGAIATDLMLNYVKRVAAEQGVEEDVINQQLLSGCALKTYSTPEDVANLALFLASDQARTITGQSINVDAGLIMV